MRNIRRGVEQTIDAMATISLDDAALFRFGMLLNNITVVPEWGPWLNKLDSVV